MIKSPRQKFLASKVRGEWEKITETAAFEQACDYALLLMQGQLPSGTGYPQVAADSQMQMVGAQNFVRILKVIHEPEQEPAQAKTQGLNYQAGV